MTTKPTLKTRYVVSCEGRELAATKWLWSTAVSWKAHLAADAAPETGDGVAGCPALGS